MAATMHVATAMIAPLRLSGNKPRVSIARTASMAILIKVQTMSRFLPFSGEYAPGIGQFPARPAATTERSHGLWGTGRFIREGPELNYTGRIGNCKNVTVAEC